MNGPRLPEQLQLVFVSVNEASPSVAVREDAEPVMAKCELERPAVTNLMEAVCERENLKQALRRVKANKGSPGIDGMTVEQLPDYLRVHWPEHRDELLRGIYTPSPVRRVEIPKPDGGVRKLGVPTVLDRFCPTGGAAGAAGTHAAPFARFATPRIAATPGAGCQRHGSSHRPRP